MQKKIVFFAAFMFFSLTIKYPAYAADDFANTALGREVVNLGLKFLDNPGDFFFNLHIDNEDFSPLPSNKHGSIRFNFFPTFFPLTWGNLNAKVKLLNDKTYTPQIDLIGTYGDILALRAISGDVQPRFSDYSIGLVASKAANTQTRFFGGIKYSNINMEVSFSTPVVLGAFEMSSLKFQITNIFLFTGISHQTSQDRYVTAQIGYGLENNKLVSRIMISRKHVEFGMDIFPEGLFVLHPFLAWHWYF